MGRVTHMRIHNDLAKLIKKEKERISKEIGVDISLVSASELLAKKFNGKNKKG